MTAWFTTVAAVEATKRHIEKRVAAGSAEPNDEGWIELTYPPGIFLFFGITSLLLALLCGAWLWFDAEATFEPATGLAFFLAGGVGMLIERHVKVWVGPLGLDVDSPWKPNVSLDWHDVTEVRWCPKAMWYRVRGATGTVRVHSWLGTDILEDQMIRHLDEQLVRKAILERKAPHPSRAEQCWQERRQTARENAPPGHEVNLPPLA
ncbi:MAG: hypothetical protein P8N09_13810 [Planctomycetota bacterium]|jgi:hypothetical protein|nr:hypothetical protein [Planctomycetota bacterium]